MARAAQINTVTQRADDSIWKKIDNNTWKQLQDGHNTNAPKAPSRTPGATAGEQPKGEWGKLREKYDLDGHLPDSSVAPEHVEIDTEGDIDTKPVLKWRDASGKVRKSYTRTFHLQRSYALHKACRDHSDAIFAAMDKAEEMVKAGDDGAATAYAALLTGHRPKVFQSVTPDRVRVYRDQQLEKSFVDELIEKADTRDPRHPNRVHVMYDHPHQGAAISSFYDATLADHIARGGSFGDPGAVMDALGMSGIDFGVVRHHANLRMAADNLSKTPYPEYGIDFESWNNGAMSVVGGLSAGIAAHYGHGPAPQGMSFVPVSATVATVDELGGGKYWPGTFPERKPYVEKLAEEVAPEEPAADDFADLDAELDAALEEPPAQKKASLLESLLPDVDVGDLVHQVEAPVEKGDINWTPPEGVRAACRAGLKLKEQGHGGAGLRPATVAWARKLAAGKPITPEKARKMNAWFARHSKGSSAAGLSDKTSPAWVAWQLWGGNAGKAWSAKLVRQMDARKSASHEVQQCESSPSGVRKSSNEPSATPSPTPTPTEPSSSTPTTRAPSSRTPTPSPEASSSPGILSPPTGPLLVKAREVFAESVLACLRGKLSPMTVVEAARYVLLDDPQGVFDVMLKAVSGAPPSPPSGKAPAPSTGVRSPNAYPEGSVSRYRDGTVVKKVDGDWKKVSDKQGKKGRKVSVNDLEVLISKYRARITELRKQKIGDDKLKPLSQKLNALIERRDRLKNRKSASSYETWVETRLSRAWAAVNEYCKYMGYTRAEQLLYAVAADDTPVSVAQHTRELVKAWGVAGIDQRLEVRRGS
jgi:hypothetical protein